MPILLMVLLRPALAADPAVFRFEDAGSEARFQALTQELRCLVCQNQSLADSHAELAGDLRREVHEMIKAGKEDREIIDFLVRRYGDFVLYRPPLDPRTAALWLGPIGLLVLAGLVGYIAVRRRGATPPPEVAAEERARILALLQSRPEDGATGTPSDR
ncbi:MAG: cytochrome c-type biogenesis protein CcmH [Beggiatoa sp.]|nr:cytochrome c-type biogenesis protein CcmH [Beggiatoa sp.]